MAVLSILFANIHSLSGYKFSSYEDIATLTLIGGMAFTNYLMQTLLGIAIFYGIGLG